ncbi:translocation/assembly module TamB domain-containing protein [Thalassovita aquimarina]|uniref:Translocation/assembly module TamB domain-containing protein n=1 Tax=Thalassovita aquimarina TaxID=2785917 RepID=A0ABS5HWF5_9RHOB|nr:translocation/assembly module TamB domain-containing protein [Thalassovita aquimarina]MBR9653219.1 translocation/assembly module TamB domain-containing protein [Thalassovita aquimarina]
MRKFILPLLLIAPLSAPAQENTGQDDRGYLEALLEDSLSSPGAQVDITGFEGALSSTATIERLSIADADGIWLQLDNLSLDWNRSALLRGNLQVNELSAGEITFDRLPLPEETGLPAAEAPGFALPDLPISVDLGKLSVGKATLGAALLGQELTLSLNGSAKLVSGAGSANLSVRRLDVAEGALEFSASFSNETNILSLDLDLHEPAGGIVASQLSLPGGPAVDLTVKGEGPVEDFAADLTLATDGQQRLQGNLTMTATSRDDRPDAVTDLVFGAEIGGDLAPLFAPDYRAFFGPDIRLRAEGKRLAEGDLHVDQLTLSADALSLQGKARLSAEGWPELLQLDGQIRPRQGDTVLLPLSGPATRLRAAEVSLNYDAAQGDGWRLNALLDGLERPDMRLGAARVTGTGRLQRGDGSSLGQVAGQIDLSASGIGFTDAALQTAIGTDLRGKLGFDWSENAPLNLTGMELTGGDYRTGGDLTISGISDRLNIVLAPDLTVSAQDLARFSVLAGRRLGGAASVAINGEMHPLSGRFELTIDGETRDLALSQPQVDPLLQGRGTLHLNACRDANGSSVEDLSIATDHVEITGDARLRTGAGSAELAARITDLARVVEGIGGAAKAELRADLSGGQWQVDARADGPGGAQVAAVGSVAEDATTMNMALTGTAPLALANRILRPRQLAGLARIDLRLDGAPSLAALSGEISTSGARLALPTQRLALEDISGAIRLNGGSAVIDMSAGVSSGGQITLRGPVSLSPGYAADLSADLTAIHLTDPTLYDTTLDGRIGMTGPLSGGARISGTVTLGETEFRVPSTSGPSYADLPGLKHRNEPAEVRRVRSWAGLIETSGNGGSGPAYGLDLTIRAPARIFVRGRGLDAELGGGLQLLGSTDNVVPQGRFDLIRGRLDILGKRLTLTEGLIRLQGAFDPYIRFAADTVADGTSVTIAIDGSASNPGLKFSSSPDLPEDEILALVLFGRGMSSISPLQALRLGAAIRTLSGGGGGGLTGDLRRGLALDDLDLSTSEEGVTEARVGKYISDNIYSEVIVDTTGNSQINLNLQISPSLTARGRLGSDGETGIGVFFERDY